MIAGHVLFRNECSGMEEQLEIGSNGFLLESTDFWQVVRTIETILDRRRTTDEQLAEMSARSRQIALGMREHRYDRIIELIGSSFASGRSALKGPHFDRHKPHVRAAAPVRRRSSPVLSDSVIDSALNSAAGDRPLWNARASSGSASGRLWAAARNNRSYWSIISS